MNDPALKILPGREGRRSEEILNGANNDWMTAVKSIRLMEDELHRQFSIMETARQTLDSEGMQVRCKFGPAMSAAYNKWRDEQNGALPTPELLRD